MINFLIDYNLRQFILAFFILQHPEFSFLLKERVCALVIKLFSPNIKYRNSVPASMQPATPLDKPYFPISMRLLRVVSILVQKYHSLLVSLLRKNLFPIAFMQQFMNFYVFVFDFTKFLGKFSVYSESSVYEPTKNR